MAFEIPKIEEYKKYLDIAFSRAKNNASLKRGSIRGDGRIRKSRMLEIIKIDTVNESIRTKMSDVIQSFPNLDNLTEFYNELVRATIDYKELKKSLGALNWAKGKTAEFSSQYKLKVRKCSDLKAIRDYGKQYYGRTSSVMKQVRKNLLFLDEARKVMKDYPSIKDGVFTVAIAGFPNIGKSTLLSKLTSSKPEIKPYAFTTKKLNVGYMKAGLHRIQFIDTPGTLNRIDRMNNIEKTAYLATKYCAHLLIYIYDLTEPYDLKDQKKLLKKLKEMDKPIIIFLSKTDILKKESFEEFAGKNKAFTDIKSLKERIVEEFNKYRKNY